MTNRPSLASALRYWRPLCSFGFVSLIGLSIDTGLFLSQVHAGIDPFVANILSAGVAVTFVYFASVRRIFDYEGHWLFRLFAAYVVYQICGVLVFSAGVAVMIAQGVHPLLAKLLILPLSFSANFLFMRLLTRSRTG